MKFTRMLPLIVVIMLVLGTAQQVLAITFTSAPVYAITCTGVTQTNPAAQVQWTRDTTGTGRENLKYTVTDGDGTVIFSFDDIRNVGSTAGMAGWGFAPAPDNNPITIRLTSPAGNGFPEQVLNVTTGTCVSLPTIAPPAGSTSAAVVAPFVWDDRVNHDQARDLGEPVAIYERYQGIHIYAIDPDGGSGLIALVVEADEIGEPGATNKLIASGTNPFTDAAIQVWLLSTGELQVNTTDASGKAYIRTWTYGENTGAYEPS